MQNEYEVRKRDLINNLNKDIYSDIRIPLRDEYIAHEAQILIGVGRLTLEEFYHMIRNRLYIWDKRREKKG